MNNQSRRSRKWVIALFVFALFLIATLGVVKSIETRQVMDTTLSDENLDSIISKKIDYRLMSYDYYFIYDNSVVVDSANNVIGRMVLYTNKEEVQKYWEGDSTKTKTDLYRMLLEGRLRILEKK